MKASYIRPVLEVIVLTTNDIMTASVGLSLSDGAHDIGGTADWVL